MNANTDPPIPIAVTDQIVRQQERIDALEVALRRLLLAAENAYRMPDDTDGELAAAIEAGKDTMLTHAKGNL